MNAMHWHSGHNVAGYLPPDDEPNAYTDWSDALSALREDLERAWDDGTDEQYLDAHCATHGATSGQDFLTYTATHMDSDHDIPTAWWVTSCAQSECAPAYEPIGRHPLIVALGEGVPADIHPVDTETIARRSCDHCGCAYCPGMWCVIDWRVDFICPKCHDSYVWDPAIWRINDEDRVAQHR